MKTLEDLGYYCIDHLPPALLDETVALIDRGGIGQLAISLDLRAHGELGDALTSIRATTVEHIVLFVDARDDVLIRRYSETRRRHPFSDDGGSLRKAIALERTTLAPLRDEATFIIDTTDLTHSELKNRLLSLTTGSYHHHSMRVSIVAFGFKYGIPLDIDLLFDARFLRNPNYVDTLREKTGLHPDVAAYIEDDPDTQAFVDALRTMFDLLVPRFIAEGKSQLTIAIGCTGGRHRSVYIAKRMTDDFRERFGLDARLELRDAERN